MPRAYPALFFCQLTSWMVFSQLQTAKGGAASSRGDAKVGQPAHSRRKYQLGMGHRVLLGFSTQAFGGDSCPRAFLICWSVTGALLVNLYSAGNCEIRISSRLVARLRGSCTPELVERRDTA